MSLDSNDTTCSDYYTLDSANQDHVGDEAPEADMGSALITVGFGLILAPLALTALALARRGQGELAVRRIIAPVAGGIGISLGVHVLFPGTWQPWILIGLALSVFIFALLQLREISQMKREAEAFWARLEQRTWPGDDQ